MSEIRAFNVKAREDGEEPDSWVTGINQNESEVFGTARMLSRLPEYDWTEVWENGERVRVYVKGHCVLLA